MRGNDLVLAVKAETEAAARAALDDAIRALDKPKAQGDGSTAAWRPHSIAAAVKAHPDINLALISVPGDFARIEADNKVTLLGRGSNCINTGGEKVYPEEVEMALKAHPDVYDALVVGVVDDKYGQAVTAVIQPRGEAQPTTEEIRVFLRPMLSGYKLPRSVTYVEEIPRSATGKANYPKAKEIAVAAVEQAATAGV